MNKEVYNVRIEGIRPLLMHSCNSMLETDSSKPSRSKEHDPVKDAEMALYKDKNGKTVVPAFCVLSCLRESGKDYPVPGKGKKTHKNFIFSGVKIEPENIPLESENGYEIDLKTVVVQRSRIVRARPRFDTWALEFTMEIVDPIITPETLKAMLKDAGKYKGLLDFRPLHGLFKVAAFKKMEDNKET